MIARSSHFPDLPGPLDSLLKEESLELFGVSPAQLEFSREHEEYQQWLKGGLNGSMEYMARHAAAKFSPDELLPECRSVLMVGLNYFQQGGLEPEPGSPASGRVARYAWGRDYHNALGKRLKRIVRRLRTDYPGERFRSFVDATPLSERFFARNAGVGFTAKNTLTISSAFGSWFFLGEILSTLKLAPTQTRPGVHGACPRGCFKCGQACPTGALYEPYRLDARKCISYLTIEHRGIIEEELRPLMGDWIFGCDLCQEVCPLNVRAEATTLSDFVAHRAGERIRLSEILSLTTDEQFKTRFRGTPLMRPGRAGMIRNASIAAANTGAAGLLKPLKRLAREKNPVITEHARWAVDRLNGI